MTQKRKHALAIIDPQNDFCDQRGSLYVDGAAGDMRRLAAHVAGQGGEYSDIYISLDSHDVIAIFHPQYWLDADGAHPAPYTAITAEDFAAKKWRAAAADNEPHTVRFFDAAVRKGVDSLMIWPEHCVVSTWGHQIADSLREGLRSWREITGKAVRYFFKGENPYTEQFSVFEGVDDSWCDTGFNENLYAQLSACDEVTFAGEALSHCVEASMLSYLDRLDGDGGGLRRQKIRLLTDCTSPVTGFDRQASLDRLAARGVLFTSTEE